MQTSKWVGSPNFTTGRHGYVPDTIVIHIEDGTFEGSRAWFNNPKSGVSAHSAVSETGQIEDYVHSTDTAWHCGVLNTNGATFQHFKYENGKLVNVNLYTLGLEHAGHADKEITDAAYKASAGKIKYWAQRFNIPIDEDHIVSHKSIYPFHNCPNGAIDIFKLIELAKTAEPILPA